MAQNRLAAHAGYRSARFRKPPDGVRKPPVAKSHALSGTRPRIFSVVFSFFRRSKFWLMFFFAFHIAAAPAFAQVSKEHQLKAVFLWRLAQFTQWPSNSFEDADTPIAICVLGENPFGDALEEAVRGETAHGRKLLVQHPRAADQVRACHILYITSAGSRQAKEISAALAGRSVLTVRDADGVASSYETMIGFLTEQNKIRLRIHLKPVTAARLVLDPRLLRAAEIVSE
jgi:hypothetical protein